MTQSTKPSSQPKFDNLETPNVAPLSPEQRDRAIATLESWCNVSEEEAQEQQETGQQLFNALDDERTRIGARKLFA
jgi:hypothetical protein